MTIDKTFVWIAKKEMHCLHTLQVDRNILWLLLCAHLIRKTMEAC